MRSPVHSRRAEREPRVCVDEVPVERDRQAGLLERLPGRTRREILAALDAASGRTPDARGERWLADQGEAFGRVEDEQRDVVTADRVVGRERVLLAR